MPNLDNLIRWQSFAPDLGENRSAKKPFVVLLAVGLTKPELQRLQEASDELRAMEFDGNDAQAKLEAHADALAKVLAPFVRMGPEPLVVNSEPIDSLPKLLRLYTRVASGDLRMLELAMALRHFNSAGGTVQLFFERLSGGSVSTDPTGRAAR